jgi:hypothetical protein
MPPDLTELFALVDRYRYDDSLGDITRRSTAQHLLSRFSSPLPTMRN